ncbi:Ig-like domain-containing protein [Methylobacterium sp. HMF5984]|uniref:Ig-like domain-containing protein n=1 Tax=Methylobacterium sp. HMF5984 TaxID=3367370 RepID=UPI0038533474
MAASLLGETVSVDVRYQVSAEDSSGNFKSYDDSLYSGSFTVVNGFEVQNVSIRDTIYSSGYPQNLSGTISIDVSSSGFIVNFNGTAQPGGLIFTFTSLADQSASAVTGASETSSSGVVTGVNQTNAPTHTSTSATGGFFLYGYQPGTNISQTVALDLSDTPPADTTPPRVISLTPSSSGPTNATTLTETVTFSEAVTGVTADDFTVTTSGTATANIASVSGSGTTYTVTLNQASGDGAVRLDLKSAGTGITDTAGNAIQGGATGSTTTLDHTAPTATSAAAATAANVASTTYAVHFAEAVSGVGLNDFVLAPTGNAAGGITAVSGSGQDYTVTVSGITGTGSLALALAGTPTVNDSAGNALTATGLTSSTTHAVDRDAPSATMIIPSAGGPTNATTLTETVTFSEAVTGVTADDFTVTTSGTATANIASVSGSGTTYTVTLNQMSGDGAVRLDLKSAGTGITDIAGNAIQGGATGSATTLDHTAPNLTLALSAGTGSDPTHGNRPLITDATANAQVLNAAEFADAFRLNGTGVDANFTGQSGAVVTFTAADGHTVPTHSVPLTSDGNGGYRYAFRVDAPGSTNGSNADLAAALTDGTYTVQAATQDAAGNVTLTASQTLIVDTTADAGAVASLSVNDTTDYIVNAGEAHSVSFTVAGLDSDATALATFINGAQSRTVQVAGDGSYTVDLSGFQGTVTSALAITDVHRNIARSAGNSFDADTAVPLVPSAPTNAAIVNGYVNAANDTATQALAGTAEPGSTVTVFDGTVQVGTTTADAGTGAWHYTIGVLADGSTHSYTTTATDAAGNTSSAGPALAFTVDTTAPTAPGLVLAHDTGLFTTDHLTNDASLAITPAEAGGSFSYSVDGGAATAIYDPSQLAQGAHTVAVTQTDAAGNVSTAGSLVFTLDSVAPTAQADAASGTGVAATLTGNVLANDTDASALHVVSVQFANALSHTLPTSGTSQIDSTNGTLTIAADGSYSYHPTSTGHTVFTETVADAAGNTSQTTLTFDVAKAAIPAALSFGFALTDAHFDFSHGHDLMTAPDGTVIDLTGVATIAFTDGTVQERDGSPLVDDLYYAATNLDVWRAHVDLDTHYDQFGWHEGRNPNAEFSTSGYLAANPDVAAAGIDPLTHYDQFGWKEGRSAGPDFSGTAYLALNPDVNASGIDPLVHYLEFGQAEGRAVLPGMSTAQGSGDHLFGAFDATYYLVHNTDVATAATVGGINPDAFAFRHYLTFGAQEGRDPNAYFSTSGYLTDNSDVAASGQNPLVHYEETGWHEGRDPSATFHTNAYLSENPDVAADHIDPLQHYLQYGMAEGRHIG